MKQNVNDLSQQIRLWTLNVLKYFKCKLNFCLWGKSLKVTGQLGISDWLPIQIPNIHDKISLVNAQDLALADPSRCGEA